MNLKPTLSQGRSLNSIKLLGYEERRLRVCKIKMNTSNQRERTAKSSLNNLVKEKFPRGTNLQDPK